MTVLDEFYAGYLHYTVAFRLWTDTCRQLADCKSSLDESQALVDETLRRSMCVAGNINHTKRCVEDGLSAGHGTKLFTGPSKGAGFPEGFPIEFTNLVGGNDDGIGAQSANRKGFFSRKAHRKVVGRLPGKRRFVNFGRKHFKRKTEASEQFLSVHGGTCQNKRWI